MQKHPLTVGGLPFILFPKIINPFQRWLKKKTTCPLIRQLPQKYHTTQLSLQRTQKLQIHFWGQECSSVLLCFKYATVWNQASASKIKKVPFSQLLIYVKPEFLNMPQTAHSQYIKFQSRQSGLPLCHESHISKKFPKLQKNVILFRKFF